MIGSLVTEVSLLDISILLLYVSWGVNKDWKCYSTLVFSNVQFVRKYIEDLIYDLLKFRNSSFTNQTYITYFTILGIML